jgi:hypothetical protein
VTTVTLSFENDEGVWQVALSEVPSDKLKVSPHDGSADYHLSDLPAGSRKALLSEMGQPRSWRIEWSDGRREEGRMKVTILGGGGLYLAARAEAQKENPPMSRRV